MRGQAQAVAEEKAETRQSFVAAAHQARADHTERLRPRMHGDLIALGEHNDKDFKVPLSARGKVPLSARGVSGEIN